MRLPLVRLSRHRAAWMILCLCVPLTVIVFRNTPQPPSRRIIAYRVLKDQKNLDRELLLAVFRKDCDAAKFALASGANTNVAVEIPRINPYGACSWYVPNAFVEGLGGPWYVSPRNRYSPLHMTLNRFRESYATATPLNAAIFTNNEEMMTLLLDNGARADFPAQSPYSPLMLAAVNACDKPENLPFLRRLLKYGDTFCTGPCTLFQLPLIHYATESTNGLAVLKILLERGIDPNQRALCNGWANVTPLMMASERNISLLLSYGADIALKDDAGNTALSKAKKAHYSAKTLSLLRESKQLESETSEVTVRMAE